MAERISEKPVINRANYPKQFAFLDKEGYLCVAERGGGTRSPEDKAKTTKITAHKLKLRKRIVEAKSAIRTAVKDGKTDAIGKGGIELAKAIGALKAFASLNRKGKLSELGIA